ncbi:hypothetical protein L3X38_037247 [Prunus dulcis]|uniref:Uncharacterized protein n=1 Tax=Prunus dulcis TaxID=3755 RepID=A0AAD4V2Z7_PRUDU|nr:hypothetical protein L3X38_037247 [Prunus dulcis]
MILSASFHTGKEGENDVVRNVKQFYQMVLNQNRILVRSNLLSYRTTQGGVLPMIKQRRTGRRKEIK